MGLFNTVHVAFRHPLTGETLDITVQFKYGETRQHDYNVGDLLKWGEIGNRRSNDIGERNAKRVVVDGCLDRFAPSFVPIPELPEDFEVHIVNGRIASVVPATGRYNFLSANETYIIIED